MSPEEEGFEYPGKQGMEFPSTRVLRAIESATNFLKRLKDPLQVVSDYHTMPRPSDEFLDSESHQSAEQQSKRDDISV